MSVIRRLFKRKTSKIAGVISLILLSLMFAGFLLAMPEFAISNAGRIFIAVWSLLAFTTFAAYSSGVRPKRGRQYIPAWGIKKVERTTRGRSTGLRGL